MLKKCKTIRSIIVAQVQRPFRWHAVIGVLTILFFALVFLSFPEVTKAISVEDIIHWFVTTAAWFIGFLGTIVVAIIIWVLQFFILLAGYNGFSTAPIVELGWTMVRDVANMGFIVALLVIAFATILGREDYAIKKTLGKLILMAILINFSKLISQVIIDAAHVVTMTFLNAVSAVAGGNLIKMFNLADMRRIVPPTQNSGSALVDYASNIELQLLGATIMNLMLATIALFTLGVYMVMMLYRVVALWALIIFSPIAYAASILPATASISKDWWGQFTKNVVSAPMMVFFLWLAFATLGNGSVLGQIRKDNSLPESSNGSFGESNQYVGSERVTAGVANSGVSPQVTLSAASSWENMAAFAVAIAFLFAGIEQVQKLGVKGAGGLDGAKKWGTRIALGASGVLAAGWVAKKGVSGAKTAGKAAAYYAPGVGGRAWERRIKAGKAKATIWNSERIQKKDAKLLEMKKKGGISAMYADRMMSQRFKDRKAESWEKAAENQKKIYDSAISLGDTNAGKAKLDSTINLAAHEERDKQAFERKRANREIELMEGEKTVQKNGEKKIVPLSEKEKAVGSNIMAQRNDAYNFESEAAVSRGKADDIIATKIRKEAPRFEAAARAKNAEKYAEQFKGKSYNAILQSSKILADKISKEQDDKVREAYQSQLAGLMQVAANRDPSLIMDVLKGIEVKIDTENPGNIAQKLNEILGAGNEQQNAAMLASAFQSAGAKGAVMLPGMISEEVNPNTGVSSFAWQRNADTFKTTQNDYAGRYVNPTQLASLGPLVSSTPGFNEQDINNVAGALNGLRPNMRIASKLREDFLEKYQKSSTEMQALLRQKMSQDALQTLKIAESDISSTSSTPNEANILMDQFKKEKEELSNELDKARYDDIERVIKIESDLKEIEEKINKLKKSKDLDN